MAAPAGNYTVVTCKDASPSERYAAEQLKIYLDRITSKNFPACDEADLPDAGGGAEAAKYIAVGAGPLAERLAGPLDLADLGDEGFVIKSAGDCAVVAGGRLRGTLYGVYELLERLGCRFFTPSCEKIPYSADLTLPALDIRQKPVLEYREHWYRFYHDYPEFAVKSRINGNRCRMTEKMGGHIPYAWFVHSFEHILSPEEHFGAHPEYFSLVNGERLKEYTQLCLTNPEVLAIAIEKVKQALRDAPGARIISVSQNDWGNHCECDGCRAIDEREGAKSGSLIAFVNAVAEAIEPEFPDVIVDTLAYQQTRPAPKYLRPRHNVCVRLCTIENCLVHPFEECDHQDRKVILADGSAANYAKDMRDWAKVCDRLYVWNYVTCFAHYAMPFPNWYALKRHMKFMVDNNLKGLFQQGNFSRGDGTDLNEMRAYVITKLLWNPDADADSLMREFAEYFYGAAAEHILGYVKLMTDKVVSENIHVSFNDNCDKAYLTDEMLDQYDALLAKAAGAVSGDPVRSIRVFKASMPLRYVRLKNNAMKGIIDKPAFDKFFDDCVALGLSRIDEWVGLEKTRRAFYDGLWRGVAYLSYWWEEGGEPGNYLA